MRNVICSTIFAILFVLSPRTALSALPVTVINIPPDPNLTNDKSIGSNTQLNLFDGGSIGTNFKAGATSGTSNIEVNINGGTVGNQFFSGTGSVVNLRGGNPLGLFAGGANSTVNIYGGGIGSLSAVDGNGVINLFNGYIGTDFSARFNSVINTYGGTIDTDFTAYANSIVNIRGGKFLGDFNAVQNSSIHIFGTQFFLNNVEISKSMVFNVARAVTERNVPLRCTLANGDPLTIILNSGIDYFGQDFVATTSTLSVTLVPEPNSLGMVFLAAIALCWRRAR